MTRQYLQPLDVKETKDITSGKKENKENNTLIHFHFLRNYLSHCALKTILCGVYYPDDRDQE